MPKLTKMFLDVDYRNKDGSLYTPPITRIGYASEVPLLSNEVKDFERLGYPPVSVNLNLPNGLTLGLSSPDFGLYRNTRITTISGKYDLIVSRGKGQQILNGLTIKDFTKLFLEALAFNRVMRNVVKGGITLHPGSGNAEEQYTLILIYGFVFVWKNFGEHNKPSFRYWLANPGAAMSFIREKGVKHCTSVFVIDDKFVQKGHNVEINFRPLRLKNFNERLLAILLGDTESPYGRELIEGKPEDSLEEPKVENKVAEPVIEKPPVVEKKEMPTSEVAVSRFINKDEPKLTVVAEEMININMVNELDRVNKHVISVPAGDLLGTPLSVRDCSKAEFRLRPLARNRQVYKFNLGEDQGNGTYVTDILLSNPPINFDNLEPDVYNHLPMDLSSVVVAYHNGKTYLVDSDVLEFKTKLLVLDEVYSDMENDVAEMDKLFKLVKLVYDKEPAYIHLGFTSFSQSDSFETMYRFKFANTSFVIPSTLCLVSTAPGGAYNALKVDVERRLIEHVLVNPSRA